MQVIVLRCTAKRISLWKKRSVLHRWCAQHLIRVTVESLDLRRFPFFFFFYQGRPFFFIKDAFSPISLLRRQKPFHPQLRRGSILKLLRCVFLRSKERRWSQTAASADEASSSTRPNRCWPRNASRSRKLRWDCKTRTMKTLAKMLVYSCVVSSQFLPEIFLFPDVFLQRT